MFSRMESESHDELIPLIGPDVMTCLGRCSYFEKLDGLLSPQDNSVPVEKCDGSFRLSETILIAAGFDRAELKDVFAVLHSKGGCCDCEVLYDVAEKSRLKVTYWCGRTVEQTARTAHTRHSRTN
jgi:uncharacterized protein DUF2695